MAARKPDRSCTQYARRGDYHAANYVYSSAKPDGLTLLAGSAGTQIGQLVGMSAVHYDVLKMAVLVGMKVGLLFYTKTGIIDKPEDLLKAKGIVFGGTQGAVGYVFICANQVLNFLPTEKVVVAYSGSGDSFRAFLAGVSMSGGSTPTYVENVLPYVKKGEVMPLFQTGLLDEKGNVVKDPSVPSEIFTVSYMRSFTANLLPVRHGRHTESC